MRIHLGCDGHDQQPSRHVSGASTTRRDRQLGRNSGSRARSIAPRNGHEPLVIRTLLILSTLLVCWYATPANAAQDVAPTKPVEQAAVDSGGDGPGRVYLSPIRFETQEAEPGDTLRYLLTVRNTTGEPVRLTTSVLPLEGATDADGFAQVGRSARTVAAAEWFTFPGFEQARELGPGRELQIPAVAQIPKDATPGTYALGLAVTQVVSALGTSTDQSNRVRLAVDLTSVAVIRVKGETSPEVRLRDIRAPRLIWNDDAPEFRVRVDNVGDTDLMIDGQVELNAFWGAAGRTLADDGPKGGKPTLPGGRRDLVMRWSDPPLLGWFQPELVVVGGKGSGVRATRQLDTVYVLPPWWLLILCAVAIALPVRARIKRRKSPEWQMTKRARSHAKVERRLREAEAKRRAEEARKGRK